MTGNRLALYGHVMRKYDMHMTRRVLSMKTGGYVGRGTPNKNGWTAWKVTYVWKVEVGQKHVTGQNGRGSQPKCRI